MRDGDSQVQAYQVNQTINHADCMTSCGMGYMCKVEGKMTQALYLSNLQDEAMKKIEWFVSTLLMSYFSLTMILNKLQN